MEAESALCPRVLGGYSSRTRSWHASNAPPFFLQRELFLLLSRPDTDPGNARRISEERFKPWPVFPHCHPRSTIDGPSPAQSGHEIITGQDSLAGPLSHSGNGKRCVVLSCRLAKEVVATAPSCRIVTSDSAAQHAPRGLEADKNVSARFRSCQLPVAPA